MTPARLILCISIAISTRSLLADDWSRFRGPNGSGVSAEAAPTKWSPSENLHWKIELPGPGVSSPIVVGDRVFVTCYSGYGVDRENPGDIENLKRHLVCIDRHSGRELWSHAIPAAQPEDPFSGIGVPAHGYASHTPVSDGERVYAFFGKSGVFAFDLDGSQLWQASVGTSSDPWAWGSSSSPVLYQDRLIVTAAAESEALVALDCQTGQELWRESAGGFVGMWGTPTLLPAAGERPAELVLSVPFEIWSFDPENGKLLWFCEASESEQAHASAIADDGVVYAFSNRGGGAVAVRPGGRDDVTNTHVLWKKNQSASFGTPIAYNGKIYLITNDVVTTVDAQSGNEIGAKLRLRGRSGDTPEEAPRGRGGRGGRGGGDYASPVIAGDKLYYLKVSGELFFIQLGVELKQLSVNTIAEDGESFGGTPAVSQGQIFIRSNKHLLCIAL